MKKQQIARKLRRNQTKSEALLWSVLRAKQLCGLKFRRQHPIGPFFADFACVERMLVVEIDGDCHDYTGEYDLAREEILKRGGWNVIRFSAEEVEGSVEDVGLAIAKVLELTYDFVPRCRTGSGLMAKRKHTRG
jgi:very-short-patch-repair endonuclease